MRERREMTAVARRACFARRHRRLSSCRQAAGREAAPRSFTARQAISRTFTFNGAVRRRGGAGGMAAMRISGVILFAESRAIDARAMMTYSSAAPAADGAMMMPGAAGPPLMTRRTEDEGRLQERA